MAVIEHLQIITFCLYISGPTADRSLKYEVKKSAEGEILLKVTHNPSYQNFGEIKVFLGNSDESSQTIAYFTDISSACSTTVSYYYYYYYYFKLTQILNGERIAISPKTQWGSESTGEKGKHR